MKRALAAFAMPLVVAGCSPRTTGVRLSYAPIDGEDRWRLARVCVEKSDATEVCDDVPAELSEEIDCAVAGELDCEDGAP